MKLGSTQNGYVGHIYDRKCKGSKDLPTATIRVKKAEKTLQDVSNSWAADGGECEENSTMFLIFQQHNVSLRINLFTDPKTATFVLCTNLPKDMTMLSFLTLKLLLTICNPYFVISNQSPQPSSY